nr:hypothetical protein [Tanacetum cinerariifolium]
DALGTKQYKPEDLQELFRELSNDVQNIYEELAEYINTPGWNRPAFYDDDDDGDDVDYTIAITLVLSTEKPIDSLRMGDEHLDTISATGSDEVIKSSVEDLVPIPSESKGIPEHMYDVPFHDNYPPLDILKDQFEDFSESNDEFSSTDNDSFSIDNIDYVEASPPDSDNPPPSSDCKTKSSSTSLNSLLESDFYEFTDELSHIISPPEYDCFYFWNLPDPGELMSVLNSKIRENLSSTTRVNLPIEDDHSPLLAYVVWMFLSYLITNVVNAPREPFVVKQDHGVKSSQNPSPIDKCCCECGNGLDGIFCQQCICKSCGKGAHIGYNCSPKVPIISNPEQCNQTINKEPPQTLPSFDYL